MVISLQQNKSFVRECLAEFYSLHQLMRLEKKQTKTGTGGYCSKAREKKFNPTKGHPSP